MMRMTDPLTAVELPEGGALCAVSGGLDSMCLLEMTVRQGQKQGRRVAAAHFNHQLRGAEADRDEAFVRDWCAAREIPFFAGRGDVRAFAEETGRTVEEAARQLRYKFLEETRRREGFGCILTAHHADDSAETMLLNLLRGTGLKGLTGIRKAGLYPASAAGCDPGGAGGLRRRTPHPLCGGFHQWDGRCGPEHAAPSGAPGFEEAESQSCGEHEPHGIAAGGG